MRYPSLAILSLALFAPSAQGQESIPAGTVTAIKAATVFVKVEAEGLSASGSGFVIKTEGDIAYVVTNHHVIEPKALELILVPRPGPSVPRRSPRNPRMPYSPAPPMQPSSPSYTPHVMVRSFKNAVVTVVFSSGTNQEETVRGEILAADPEQDLAVLKVIGVKTLPKPIDYLHEPKLVETTPVYVFGFPFGKVLSTSKGGPAITVGKGSVSSLRMDDNGELALLQIDGALNPGNSGGPVVDAQGRLAGVAVATIRNSSGIGLAIPCRQLVGTLEGRLGKAYLHTSQDADGRTTVHVEVGLIDPLHKIKSATLCYLAANSLTDKPKPADPLAPLPGCRKLPLKLEEHLATGEFTLKRGVAEVSLLHQAVYVNETGKEGHTVNVAETIRAMPAAVAVNPGGGTVPSMRMPPHAAPESEAQILGGGSDPRFTDAAPPKGLLIGFEVGLGKWAGNDVVCALRPIFSTAQGEEVLGRQHGADTSRLVRVKAKPGYAVAALTAKAAVAVDGFSVTFMKVDKDRLNPKDAYESEWIGGKGSGPPTRLGDDGAPVTGIIGKENSKDCTGLGLLQAAPTAVAARAPTTIAPPGAAALEDERTIRALPAPIDDVAAGGNGRYLLFHLEKLRKLAVFDVAQAKITHYVPLSSDNVLFAAGAEKLIIVVRNQSVIQRYDLATQKMERTAPLPEVGQLDGLALGYASAGPAMLMTRQGPRLLNLEKLELADPKEDVGDNRWRPHPQYPLQVRASADGSTFAAWEPGLSPGGIRLLTLDGDTAKYRYEHSSAGVLQPSYDGNLLFTGAGLYSADLKPLSADRFHGIVCIPAYHPAYFLGFDRQNRIHGHNTRNSRNRAENPKLSLYTTGDKRLLVSFTEFDELNDPQETPFNRFNSLSIDKRVHFFPTANLLVTVASTRDQLVLRRLEVTAALEKAGIDYLYVASLPPPPAAARGSKFTYAIAVQSRQGRLQFALDSGPEGMTLSADGKLQWNVPADQAANHEAVIVTIKDASGQEIQHSFNIAIR